MMQKKYWEQQSAEPKIITIKQVTLQHQVEETASKRAFIKSDKTTDVTLEHSVKEYWNIWVYRTKSVFPILY